MLYYLETASQIVLRAIYSKSDQGDLSAKAIRDIPQNASV